MKSGKCAFQIDQFQGRPSPKNALALASKNRRRFASLAICLPKSLEAARLLRTVRTSRWDASRRRPAATQYRGSRLRSLRETKRDAARRPTRPRSRRSWPRAWDRRNIPAVLAVDRGRTSCAGHGSDRRSWFPPALCGAVHAGTMSWLAGANPSPIALNDGQVRGTLGTLGQGVGSLGIGITTLGQFPTDVVHHTLDRLGRDRLVTHVSHHQPSPLERTRFRRRECHPLDQQGRQFAGIKPQRLPVGGKRPGGRPGNNLAAPRLRQGRRSRSPCVS